jgi:hypothetical protein
MNATIKRHGAVLFDSASFTPLVAGKGLLKAELEPLKCRPVSLGDILDIYTDDDSYVGEVISASFQNARLIAILDVAKLWRKSRARSLQFAAQAIGPAS